MEIVVSKDDKVIPSHLKRVMDVALIIEYKPITNHSTLLHRTIPYETDAFSISLKLASN